MAIQVQVRKADLVQLADGTRGIALDITTTNDSFAGESLRFGLVYPTTLTAAQIKTAVNGDVSLLWAAKATPTWTV